MVSLDDTQVWLSELYQTLEVLSRFDVLVCEDTLLPCVFRVNFPEAQCVVSWDTVHDSVHLTTQKVEIVYVGVCVCPCTYMGRIICIEMLS